MIKVEHIDFWGFKHAIRGMRNPLNSWARSDSHYNDDGLYVLGPNDLDLCKRLIQSGPEHRKFLRQICISMDVTAPMYWWSEYDTYKVGTVANSCSKMHKLLSKPFEMGDFSFDHLPGYKKDVTQFRPEIDEEMVASEKWAYINSDYAVSNYGRVKHIFKDHYRILSGSLHQDGYVFVTIRGQQIPVHKLVAMHFCDNPDNKPEVNHLDGNKQNNFASNLEYCTSSENQQHAVDTGLQPRGLSHYKGKFSEEQRMEIKRLWDEGIYSKRKIAEMYDVSHTCINDIITDKYKYAEKVNIYKTVCAPWVDMLNELRDSYLRCQDPAERKEIWYSILAILPVGYNQKRTVTMNYEVALSMIRQRSNHKLNEWHDFANVLMEIPYISTFWEAYPHD